MLLESIRHCGPKILRYSREMAAFWHPHAMRKKSMAHLLLHKVNYDVHPFRVSIRVYWLICRILDYIHRPTEVEGMRNRGRPRQDAEAAYSKTSNQRGLEFSKALSMTKDKEGWRTFVRPNRRNIADGRGWWWCSGQRVTTIEYGKCPEPIEFLRLIHMLATAYGSKIGRKGHIIRLVVCWVWKKWPLPLHSSYCQYCHVESSTTIYNSESANPFVGLHW